jgi:glycosyltransferase involved in cell wall biosynthesis
VRVPRGYAFSPRLIRDVWRATAKADVVHVHGLYQFHTLVAASAARRLSTPYVLHIHGALTPYHRSRKTWKKRPYELLIERSNLSRAATVIHMTEAERASFNERYSSAQDSVVPAPVAPELFASPEVEEIPPELGAFRGARLVTFLGRLTEKKGLELLVEAFAQVTRAHADAHLVIAGPDDEGLGRALLTRAAARRIADRVTLLGLVEGPSKRALLWSSSAFVLPSADESFGIAAAEALACGVPAVVTREVGLSKEIERAGAGIVVDRAVEPLAAAIGHLLGDARSAEALSRGAQRLAQEKFTVDAVCGQLEAVYRGVLTSRHADHR